ncbi:T9SS type A sorting domain-containing protein [Niastella caeni]|uniref:T9SS type A sorting domain-containing protein n=1 Tax=Niastella caeni TaxID=2569763 RepID=A0A4S8HVJ5_9BACT|nr:T9SS type A sorting domain-containing protein [Niastella caeni]THU39663.1 T9SS type A sorting domain-containing protein [Niastella caeni]
MNPNNTNLARRLLHTVFCITILSTLSFIAHAQLGSGWVQYSPTKKIHLDNEDGLQTFNWTSYKSVCSPICADYSYASSTETETFRLLDNRTNRSEIRLQNEYSSGSRQFEGYVTFYSPLNDESLMQIFGSTSGATQLMIRGYAASGGSIRGGGQTLATNVYGKEVRVNVIHLQENAGNKIVIYINGVKKAEIADNESVTNYHKYGNYGTLTTDEAVVKWRRVRHFRDGRAPSAAAVTARAETVPADESPASGYNIRVYPNPVAGKQAVIRYTLPKPASVRIAMYNINGQVEEIVNRQQQAGEQTVYWNTANKPAGTYITRITIGSETMSVKVTVKR